MLNKASVLSLCAVIALSFAFFVGDVAAYQASDIKTANHHYAQKSYHLAATQYETFLNQKTTREELVREVQFKWADSILKAKDQNRQSKAIKTLTTLTEVKTQDKWAVEAGVSLAEHYIAKDPWGKRDQIKKWLEEAREWWAGSSDIKTARARFIAISFTLADFVTERWGWHNPEIRPLRLGGTSLLQKIIPQKGSAGLEILFEEILKVAKTDADKARAYYGLAMMHKNTAMHDPKAQEKIEDGFEKIIEDYSKTAWADDAWYHLGSYYENRQKFPEAVKTYQGFLKRYRAGQSKWVDDIRRRVEYITKPTLSLGVSNNFVPNSQIRFHMNWRNMAQAQMTLYKLDLSREVLQGSRGDSGYSSYRDVLRHIVDNKRYHALPVQARWTARLKNDNKHMQHNAHKGLAAWQQKNEKDDVDPKNGQLPEGAYLLMAVGANGTPAYDLVLVSDIALVSKISKDTALFYAIDAKTGQPIAGADVTYSYSWYQDNYGTRWERARGKTGADGVLVAELKNESKSRHYYHQQHNVFAAIHTKNGKQAFVQNNYYKHNYHNKGEWWLYAFTDRPAYRPNETVSFKAIVRHPEQGQFTNPSHMKVKARIYDAQGKQVKEAHYTLNAYGALADTLVLDDKATLGEYRLHIYDAQTNNQLSTASLFRLEEYKLPEFVVNVKAKANEDGQTIYRLGDKLEVEIDSQYYFGGAVADADVEYLVYQQPYHHSYRPVKPYQWYYEDMRNNHRGYGGHGPLLLHKKIKTDKEGKASFTIETPKDSAQDLKYHVEVRVVDKSRREIRGTQDIKVTKNAFFVHMQPQQNLYRPGDKVTFKIKTLTANNDPMPVKGKITIKRNWWNDKKPQPENKSLERVAPRHGHIEQDMVHPNPVGYEGRELFTKFVTTNEKGEATFTFEPNENGYYTAEFTGFDNSNPVAGQTHVFVSDNRATNIGYRYSGLQIILEKDTYSVGETARAMIVSDTPDSWVLFTQESDELYGYNMFYMKDSVKLVDIPVRANYTPNVFFHALSGREYQLKSTQQQIIVPPDEKFLQVKIISDKATYQPRENGVFDVTVTDKDGKPVQGEVALGLVDASVYYIQQDYAEDIRKFFYGDKRPQSIRTQASFYQRAYVDLVQDKKGNVLTKQEAARLRQTGGANNKNDMPTVTGDTVYGRRDMGQKEGFMALGKGAAGSPMRQNAVLEERAEMDSLAAAPAESKRVARKKSKDSGAFSDDKAAGQDPAEIRNDFRSTIHWQPFVVTNEKGQARIQVTFPDSLTTWRMTARAVTQDTAVGNVTHEVKSNKDLMVRLQAPRFFTVRDLTVVSAVIDNMSEKDVTVMPRLKAKGLVVSGLYRDGKFVKGEMGPAVVPAKGQIRVDWAVSAQEEGLADLTVSAQAQGIKLSDAMQKSYPVFPHGIEKFVAKSLALKGEGSFAKELSFDIPAERIKDTTSLRLTVSPSLAANMMDALPYLAAYPYGCVEQTMSRFLPAAVVHKTMRESGISKQDVDTYINNVLALRDDPVHPDKSTKQTHSELDKMVGDGLKRLYDFQHSDGGWGWWKTDDSDRFMTAYVLWGLRVAQDSGVDIKAGVAERAARYLQVQLVEEEDNPDMLAWMLHALANGPSSSGLENKQRDRLWTMRNDLNPYTRALFALGEHKRGNTERSRILAENALNGVLYDAENGTAHWGESGVHYRWSNGGVEATAFVIKALSQINPDSKYLDEAVKWISLNRRGGRWKNTRDTAISVLGLADYLKASNELAPDYSYEILLNGKAVRKGRIHAGNVFAFNRNIDIPAKALRDGKNTVKVVMKGKGALYLSAHAKFFTLEEDITKEGNEIFVDRKYYIQSVKETLMKGYTNDWKLLKEGDTVNSGDRIRVDIMMEAKNHYEYLLTEDYKPAGLEAVALTSGRGYAVTLDNEGHETSQRTPLYQEFRDEKAAFFISKLKQGKHLIRYELRAEIPGQFHAMPNMAHAMYVPEIRANSDEMRINVQDKPAEQ